MANFRPDDPDLNDTTILLRARSDLASMRIKLAFVKVRLALQREAKYSADQPRVPGARQAAGNGPAAAARAEHPATAVTGNE